MWRLLLWKRPMPAALLLVVFAFWSMLAPAFAQIRSTPYETSAKQAILFDHDANTVLFERKADEKIQPGSLAKLMTVELVFRELQEGRLKFDQDMVVSADAWRRGGAVSGSPNMLLTPNKIVKVGELVYGLIIGSANDAAITLAENIAGTEARFVEMMNARAEALKLTTLTFKNATGFVQEGQEGALRDYVTLSAHIIRIYPEYYTIFSQKDMPYGKNRQANRNPLIGMEIGADGLMTGSVPDVGHALIGSSVVEGRRVIIGIAGLETVQERAVEARKLLEWGQRRYEIRMLYEADTEIGAVALYGGAARNVGVKTPVDIRLPVLRGTNDGLTLRLAYRGPIVAPVAAGAELARLEVVVEGRVIQSAPLVAVEGVAEGTVLSRARDAALELSRQWVMHGFSWVMANISLMKKPVAPAANINPGP